jgi:hypothetical protein
MEIRIDVAFVPVVFNWVGKPHTSFKEAMRTLQSEVEEVLKDNPNLEVFLDRTCSLRVCMNDQPVRSIPYSKARRCYENNGLPDMGKITQKVHDLPITLRAFFTFMTG